MQMNYEYMTTKIRLSTVTEKAAIEAVEKYLSQPLTKEYYDKIKCDTYHEADWKEAQEIFPSR